MPTIEDVAALAGVSVATVSRVLNSNYMVTKEKRERVMQAVKALNYQPNMLGRNLRRSETKMVLVMCGVAIIDEVLAGIEDAAKELGYDVILSYVGKKKSPLDSIKFLQNGLVDGVILLSMVSFNNKELINISNKYPVVQCCEYVDIPNSNLVSVDNERAAYDIVSHLISLGRKRIGIITLEGLDINPHFSREREKGYRRALADFGLTFDENLKKMGDYTYESGVEAAKQFMSMKERPDAVFSIQDTMGVACINTFKKEGLCVPRDIAVAGFDNFEISEMCEPRLTTVAQPFYEIGYETMKMVVTLIKGEITTSRRVFLDHQILIRGSTVENK